MSPEQCRGQNVDHRTDIYSFGVLCHQVFTGRLPFDAEAVMDILVKHMTQPPPPVSAHAPELGTTFDAPILRMMEKQPEQRPPTVSAALDELARAATAAGMALSTSAIAPASALGGVAHARTSPSGPPIPKHLTPAQVAEIERARTISGTAAPARTLTPAESDAAPLPKKNTPLYAILGLVAVVAIGAGVFVMRGQSSGSNATTGAASSPPKQSATTTASIASAGSFTSATASAPPPPADPTEVEVTFQTTPAKAAIYQGAKKLGDAPGPIKLPFGKEKVALTIKAAGFQDEKVEITPSANVVVPATLKPLGKAGGGGNGPAVPKDLEPF
jgi:serine/threonine-protein kinase